MSERFDWWYRIRRVVKPPGTPSTRVGVPTDAEAARERELAAVFAHVDGLEPELRAREAAAEAEVAATLDAAEERAGRIAADSREGVAAVRADAVAGRRREFEDRSHDLERRALDEAAQVRRRARSALPALVDDAVRRVRLFAVAGDTQAPGCGGA